MVRAVLAPHAMIKRLNASAERILAVQPRLKSGRRCSGSNGHAVEFLKIQNEAMWHSEELMARWRAGGNVAESEAALESGAKPPRRRRRRRKPVNNTQEALPQGGMEPELADELGLAQPPLEVGI